MDCPLPEAGKGVTMRITYYVQRYRPQFEAVSKEVSRLAGHFRESRHFKEGGEVKVYNLHLDGLFNFKFNSRFCSHHFLFYPLLFPLAWLASRRSRINHIYTSLGDRPYLNVLNPQRTVLTAAASCHFRKVLKRKARLKKLRKIVVESERQKEQLKLLGIDEKKVEMVYPPVNLDKFSYQAAKGRFKILYASCPTREKDFEKRGVHLILEHARKNPEEFIIPWRKGAYRKMDELVRRSGSETGNIRLFNQIIKDMNQLYAEAHCTIIPYTRFDDFLKLIPNSALESLAAGKPLLVSTKTEIAKIVEKERCGVVFEPEAECLRRAVSQLKKNYLTYQRNCRRTAEKYFSEEKFLREYEIIYREISS